MTGARAAPRRGRATRAAGQLLLGEWACLGIVAAQPAHGFAVAARLRPDADIGRIWSLSRPLTYRALEQLVERRLIEPIGEEPGAAGGTRTVMAATDLGRSRLRRWIQTPADHVRDLRSELLLKIVLADENRIDVAPALAAQRARVEQIVAALAPPPDSGHDIVELWRYESARAALRVIDRLAAGRLPGSEAW